MNKIGIAWQSYLARGVSPSKELEEAFIRFSECSAKENWETIEIPEEIISVFDRLVNMNKEKDSENSKQQEPRIKLSKRARVVIVLSVMWISYAIFRMSGYYELFGLEIDRWDDEAFFVNVFGPICAVFGAIYLYRWVQKGR